MRHWHRWIALILFFPLTFIAATGLLSHWAALWPEDGVALVAEAQAHGHEAAAAKPTPPPFVCPEGWRCRPAPPETGPRAWTGFFHHLHSGEEFGPLGTALSILSGFALLFFALSGMWMYARMWSERGRRGARARWFWR